ncbi:MAG: carboxypeptidase-like regulatory domain-containing protein [Bacteroidales bacterium]|nr:carboxypeptidase-like regulatory domain-containing protein [Bacteroidales bacterium]
MIIRISKTLILSLIILASHSPAGESQILKGKITDKSGAPIEYATVFIQELKQGTTANAKGDYELKLPDGNYLVIYQSLGYEPVFANIVMAGRIIEKNVVLNEQYYEIPEVMITASGEDPAYAIMRKTIGMAQYYLNHVRQYKADVYLKGTLVVNKIPKIVQRSINAEARNSSTGRSVSSRVIKEGDVYLMESFNEIEFNAPDRYNQKVISYNSTFPEQDNNVSPMDYIQASFYQPVIADMAISPLSPQAFSYYSFKYLGATPQGNFTINKIEVIPKRKSQQLFAGTIFIVDDLWCLHSVNLTNENIAGKIDIQQLYIDVGEEIWMPVSHKFFMSISILGFKADASYTSSVKYREVKLNEALQKPASLTADYIRRSFANDTAKSKTSRQIESILSKEEINNRDMVRLSRLMKKETERSSADSLRKSLEISEKTTYTIDEGAGKHDSAYWAEIRPIPLSETELKSIRITDSIKRSLSSRTEIRTDADTVPGKKQKSRFGATLNSLAFGHTWRDTSGFSFTYGGLIDPEKFSFNTVDGFVYGMDFRISKYWKKAGTLSFYPDIRYAFSRNKLMWNLNGNFSFDSFERKQIFFRAGASSRDFNSDGGIDPMVNSVASLLFRKNYLKLYGSQYITAGYRTDIANGLQLELSVNYENRKILDNTTDFSFFSKSKEYSDNIPDNQYLSAENEPGILLYDHRNLNFVTNVTFVPFQKYRVIRGVKVPQGSDWPTFRFTWKHGINSDGGSFSEGKHFDLLRFEASMTSTTGAFSQLRWSLGGSGFLNKGNLSWIDFQHFNTQPLPILLNNYEDAFMLPGFYSFSTPEVTGDMHLKYTTPYLLLKLLPFLSNTLMRENISISALASADPMFYTEIGYSLSEIFLIGEMGIYAGFEKFRHRYLGLKFTFRLN